MKQKVICQNMLGLKKNQERIWDRGIIPCKAVEKRRMRPTQKEKQMKEGTVQGRERGKNANKQTNK